jgi:hypothetical protein
MLGRSKRAGQRQMRLAILGDPSRMPADPVFCIIPGTELAGDEFRLEEGRSFRFITSLVSPLNLQLSPTTLVREYELCNVMNGVK